MFYISSPVYTASFSAQFERIFGAAYAPTAEEVSQAGRGGLAEEEALEY